MDPVRYRQQRWDSSSALEGYGGVRDPDYRLGRPFGGRGYGDGGLPGDVIYPRTPIEREILLERERFSLERERLPIGREMLPLERERLPHSPLHGIWPQARRNIDEEVSFIREAQRHPRDGYASSLRNIDRYSEVDNFREFDNFSDSDRFRVYGFERIGRFSGHNKEIYDRGDFDQRPHLLPPHREDSLERDYELSRHDDHYSGTDARRRDHAWHKRDNEHGKRDRSRDHDKGIERKRRDHSRSFSHDRSRSRSPRGHSNAKRRKEESNEDVSPKSRYDKQKDRDEKHPRDRAPVAPSATIVVKGLSQKTTEDDLYQAMATWGPLCHVRVIKERSTGLSRGFAFVDFPSIEAAQKMMDEIGDEGLVVDGRRLFLEYSSKPTGGLGAPQSGQVNPTNGSNQGISKGTNPPVDWMCPVCGCVNFARRTSCFQCNESRTEDATPADAIAANMPTGKKASEPVPTHVLVVRGLDEHIDEEMLHCEFSKYAPIKDLRLVRDKFTHVSRGFAFIHFHSVEEATKALEAINNTVLEKNGQVLRVQYAKNILGPGSASSVPAQANNLAAAAIEAATFAQQYDAVGWAPKEFNPSEGNQNQQGFGNNGTTTNVTGSSALDNPSITEAGTALQSGFIWDEASGYYYDAASGFYYDGHSGLYYDGNSGIWYSYDEKTQQYTPCTNHSADANATSSIKEKAEKASDGACHSKVIISAPAVTVTVNSEALDKKSLPEAVQAAAAAAQAAAKREKEKLKEKEKEIRLASKGSILASKKKMSNVLTMWKQRKHEAQAPRVVLDDGLTSIVSTSIEEKYKGAASGGLGTFNQIGVTSKSRAAGINAKESSPDGPTSAGSRPEILSSAGCTNTDSSVKPRPVSNSSGGTVMGVIRESNRATLKVTDSHTGAVESQMAVSSASVPEIITVSSALKTDTSARGSYVQTSGGTRRRFSETPQTVYRDRAAERRSLYGSSVTADNLLDLEFREKQGREMPFPPGVGGKGRAPDISGAMGGMEAQTFEVITSEKAIDEKNIGNRMLRNMGWQEGLGLGKDGTGILEPVQAQTTEERAGLGSQMHRKIDARFDTQPGDSYRTAIQKKALARFHEMA